MGIFGREFSPSSLQVLSKMQKFSPNRRFFEKYSISFDFSRILVKSHFLGEKTIDFVGLGAVFNVF